MKIGIVAGEKSGDYLGAELIKAFKKRYPDAEFVGLAGPLMKEQGAVSLADMDKISIMGVAGVIKGLFNILAILRRVRKHMLSWRPDVFVGIDVPDFNKRVERKLKQAGIPVVHYVSPTVWAWRGERIHRIKQDVDLMLTLFPFEEAFYEKHDVPVKFVGHPLAKSVLSWQVDDAIRAQILPNSASKCLIAILPGSRMSEVSRLAPIMLEAAVRLKARYPELEFVIPAANDTLEQYLRDDLHIEKGPVKVVSGLSRDVLALCDMAVLASGTAALEAGLFAKPMVVMYKVAKAEAWLASRTMMVEHYSMPNHLVSPPEVPELIQENANVDNLVAEVRRLLDDSEFYNKQKAALAGIAPSLSEDSGELACDAIEALIRSRVQA